MDPLSFILVILVILWLTGTVFVGSPLVHLLLVVIVIVLLVRLTAGRTLLIVGFLMLPAPLAAQTTPNLQGIDDAIRALNAAVDVLRPPVPITPTVLFVPIGGDLQVALDTATPGTTIELAQGATYTGNFILRNKAGAAPVRMRTFGMSVVVLPPGVRITMAETRLAKLACRDCFYPTLRADPGTHDVTIIAVQFVGYTPAPGRVGPATPDRDLVQFGLTLEGVDWYTTPAQILSNLTFDRVQCTASPTAGGHRCALLDGRNLRVINSDCRGFWEVGRDSQCIAVTQGPGPYVIENNYLEAGAENVIFGGTDPVMVNAIPRGIVIRGNTFSKPDAWRARRGTVKNLFELKNAIDVLVEGNLFERTWTDGQAGNAILFTVRNQDGRCSWCEVSDVVFRWNVIRDVEQFAIAILGRDYTNPSATSQRITITQNLFLGVGHGIAVTGPLEGLAITHNTIGTVRGRFLSLNGAPTTGLIVRDNVVASGEYGITGSNTAPGLAALTAFAPGFRVTSNVIEGTTERTITYPPGNYLLPPGTLAARLSPTQAYLPLAGQVASDGLPLGVDVAELRRRVVW
jgi:hypothetical protein